MDNLIIYRYIQNGDSYRPDRNVYLDIKQIGACYIRQKVHISYSHIRAAEYIIVFSKGCVFPEIPAGKLN